MRQQLLRATVFDIAPRSLHSQRAKCSGNYPPNIRTRHTDLITEDIRRVTPRNLARIVHGKQPLPRENEDPEANVLDIANGYGTSDWEDDLDDDSDEDNADDKRFCC